MGPGVQSLHIMRTNINNNYFCKSLNNNIHLLHNDEVYVQIVVG